MMCGREMIADRIMCVPGILPIDPMDSVESLVCSLTSSSRPVFMLCLII